MYNRGRIDKPVRSVCSESSDYIRTIFFIYFTIAFSCCKISTYINQLSTSRLSNTPPQNPPHLTALPHNHHVDLDSLRPTLTTPTTTTSEIQSCKIL